MKCAELETWSCLSSIERHGEREQAITMALNPVHISFLVSFHYALLILLLLLLAFSFSIRFFQSFHSDAAAAVIAISFHIQYLNSIKFVDTRPLYWGNNWYGVSFCVSMRANVCACVCVRPGPEMPSGTLCAISHTGVKSTAWFDQQYGAENRKKGRKEDSVDWIFPYFADLFDRSIAPLRLFASHFFFKQNSRKLIWWAITKQQCNCGFLSLQ